MIDPRPLEQVDAHVAALIRSDTERQNSNIHLIASENFVSRAVLEASGSVFTNKYAEGYPGRRYYEGCEVVDEVEDLARERAKALFGAEHANVQPHSGAQANMAAYFGFLKPGDKVLGMRLDQGGHLTHGSPVNASGELYEFIAYGVDRDTELIDMDDVRRLALEHRPRIVLAGYTAYSRVLDYQAFRSIADEIGALLMVDAAHFIGLVAGGAYPNPVPYADFVTATTHKALRGPRGGLILSREEHAQTIDKAVFPGMQGGGLFGQVAAKAVCFLEASTSGVSGLRKSDRRQCPGDGGPPDRRGCAGPRQRDRQPHAAGRHAQHRPGVDGQAGGRVAPFGGHHVQFQYCAFRSSQAVCRQRDQAGHPGDDHPGDERTGSGRDGRADCRSSAPSRRRSCLGGVGGADPQAGDRISSLPGRVPRACVKKFQVSRFRFQVGSDPPKPGAWNLEP